MTRYYDVGLGMILGVCLMGFLAIWQANQLGRWERLYWEQDFEIKVQRDFGTAKERLVRQLTCASREQKATIAQLASQLEQYQPRVMIEDE